MLPSDDDDDAAIAFFFFCITSRGVYVDPDIANAQTFSTNDRRAASRYKTKQGLVGFVNGFNIAAMADTGSRENVVSESYAKSRNLTIGRPSAAFEIGNSRKIYSIGRFRSSSLQ